MYIGELKKLNKKSNDLIALEIKIFLIRHERRN